MGGQINTNSTTGSSVLSGSLTNTAFNKSATWSTQDTWPSASYSTVPGYAFAGNYGIHHLALQKFGIVVVLLR